MVGCVRISFRGTSSKRAETHPFILCGRHIYIFSGCLRCVGFAYRHTLARKCISLPYHDSSSSHYSFTPTPTFKQWHPASPSFEFSSSHISAFYILCRFIRLLRFRCLCLLVQSCFYRISPTLLFGGVLVSSTLVLSYRYALLYAIRWIRTYACCIWGWLYVVLFLATFSFFLVLLLSQVLSTYFPVFACVCSLRVAVWFFPSLSQVFFSFDTSKKLPENILSLFLPACFVFGPLCSWLSRRPCASSDFSEVLSSFLFFFVSSLFPRCLLLLR